MDGTAWSPEMDTELRRQFSAGQTSSSMALTFGKTKNAVIGRLHRLGLYRNPELTNAVCAHEASFWSPDDDNILRQMWDNGEQMRPISIKLSRSISACTKRARRIGIPPRPTHYTTFLVAPWSESEISDAVEMRTNGHPWSKISAALHRQKPSVVREVMDASDGNDPKPRIRRGPTLVRQFDSGRNPSTPLATFSDDLFCVAIRDDERPSDGCRWLVNNGSPWMVCAAKRERGESYCGEHNRRAYPLRSVVAKMEQAA